MRHLPHQAPDGSPVFVTWNLKGATPKVVLQDLKQQRDRLERQPSRTGESDRERNIRQSKILFAAADGYLDRAVVGPMHLKDPEAAEIVEDSILFGAVERYDLFAWCVMSNHVHMLLTPSWRGADEAEFEKSQAGKPDVREWDLPSIMKGIKGYTAYRINKLQGAQGRVFWLDESYDHWARDEAEMMRIIEYIEENPVKAGLCSRAEEWPRSSARFRGEWRPGTAYKVRQAFQPDESQG